MEIPCRLRRSIAVWCFPRCWHHCRWRQRNEEFGGHMEDYLDKRDGMMDFNGESKFDRTMGYNGGGGDRNMDHYKGGYEGGFDGMEDYGRSDCRGANGAGMATEAGTRIQGNYGHDGYGEDYGCGGGRGGGVGLL